MRVLYDGAVFQNAHQRGVQRVFRELIDHLPREVEAVVSLLGPARCALPARAEVVGAGFPADLLPRKLRRRLAPALGSGRLRRITAGCAAFHSTYYTLPPEDRLPAVVHVHDMIPETLVDFFQGRWLEQEIERKRRSIERATHLITISHATARQLERIYPQTRGRVTAIHLGREHLERPSPSAAPGPDGPYALFVGMRALYKNFGVILDAMALPQWPRSLGLVVVGPPWRGNEALRVELLSRERNVRHLGSVEDDRLAALYRGAACVVVPSLAEGFGFPVLEGQTAQVPVVCSDVEVFREVAGDGALFFDPHRPDELAARIGEAVDPGVRASVVERGSANLPRFSWTRCGVQTAEVYRSVARV